MPTGYTAPVEDGCPFAEYVWECARAFGACVSLRDSNDPIPQKFQEISYHQDKLNEIERELSDLKKMDERAIAKKLEAERSTVEKQNKKYYEEWTLKKKRNEDMLKAVAAWIPFTPDHIALKEFMISQIHEGSRFNDTPYQQELPPLHPTAWAEIKKANLLKDFKYHKEQREKEIARVRDQNKWIDALRASVPQPDTK